MYIHAYVATTVLIMPNLCRSNSDVCKPLLSPITYLQILVWFYISYILGHAFAPNSILINFVNVFHIYFIEPVLLIQITTTESDNGILGNGTLVNVSVGDPLTLDCTVTAIRGISSPVDIIWTTGGRVVRRVNNITADIENDSATYTDSFEISSLSAIDNGREYQCTVVINARQPVNDSDQIILIFSSE